MVVDVGGRDVINIAKKLGRLWKGNFGDEKIINELPKIKFMYITNFSLSLSQLQRTPKSRLELLLRKNKFTVKSQSAVQKWKFIEVIRIRKSNRRSKKSELSLLETWLVYFTEKNKSRSSWGSQDPLKSKCCESVEKKILVWSKAKSAKVQATKMHIEIQVALNFVISYLYNKLPRRRVNIFGEELEKALKQKFQGHWYPTQPFKVSIDFFFFCFTFYSLCHLSRSACTHPAYLTRPCVEHCCGGEESGERAYEKR